MIVPDEHPELLRRMLQETGSADNADRAKFCSQNTLPARIDFASEMAGTATDASGKSSAVMPYLMAATLAELR